MSSWFRWVLPSTLLISVPVLAQARIPELHATAFSGAPINLPEGLRGHTAVLIVSFTQGSRDGVTGWSRRLAADYRESPAVLYYEMPVLEGVPRLLRGVVLGKIKKDVPARAQPRFVPVLDHEAEWKTAVGYNSNGGRPDDTYLLVVDGSGVIRAHIAAGAPTDQSYADLKRRLEAVKP